MKKLFTDAHFYAVLALVLPDLIPQLKDLVNPTVFRIVALLVAGFVLFMNKYNNDKAVAAVIAPTSTTPEPPTTNPQ